MAAQGYAQPELLAETAWLESQLDGPKVRVVDCDPIDTYRRAHVKNAVGIRVQHYLKHSSYSSEPAKYPLIMPPGPFAELMESMGIGNDTLVVAYDGAGGLYAARLWWALKYYGHTNVKVLNGGWRKWFDEGRPIAVDAPEAAKAKFTARETPQTVCTLDYGVECVGKKDTVFLDVRSDGEWNGTNTRGNKRAGHVPGAVHLEWLNFVTSDKHRTFKPAAELWAMLKERGVTPEKQVITY